MATLHVVVDPPKQRHVLLDGDRWSRDRKNRRNLVADLEMTYLWKGAEDPVNLSFDVRREEELVADEAEKLDAGVSDGAVRGVGRAEISRDFDSGPSQATCRL